MNDNIIRNIGLRIAMEARQENLAIRMMYRIKQSGFLHTVVGSDIVREFEEILDDEARHLRAFTMCACRYGVHPVYLPDELSVVLTYDPWVMLRHIYTVEQMSKYGFLLNIEIHQKVTGDMEAIEMYRAIALDEARHVAVGRKIHHAINKVPRYKEDFKKLQQQHVVENAYRDVFGDRSYVLEQFGLTDELGPINLPPWRSQ